MICKNCGREIDSNQKVCPKCGELLGKKHEKQKNIDTKNISINILVCLMGFLFPIMGIIIYIIANRKQLVNSNALLICSIIGLVFQIIF